MLRVTPEEVGVLREVLEVQPDLGILGRDNPMRVVERLEAEVKRQADLLAAGATLRDQEVLMDGDTRHTLLSWRDHAVDLEEREVVLPWYFLKELVAGILTYEASVERDPKRQTAKNTVAGKLMEECQIERAEVLARAGRPDLKPGGPVPGVDL